MDYCDYENLAQSEYKKGKKRDEIIDYLVDMDCKRRIAEEITQKMLVENALGMKKKPKRKVMIRDTEIEID